MESRADEPADEPPAEPAADPTPSDVGGGVFVGSKHHAADLAAHNTRLGAFPLAPLGTDPRPPPPELGRAALRAVRIAEYLCQRCPLRVRIDTLALGSAMSRVKLLNFVKAKC